MGDWMKKVATGEPMRIPARWFNLVTDAARDYQRSRDQGTADARNIYNPTGLIFVENDSGADRKRFEILGLDDILIDPADDLSSFLNYPSMTGVVPTADHRGYFAICAEPIRNGEVGRCFVFGATPTVINITDGTHQFADVTIGDCTKLKSSKSGMAQILWPSGTTGSAVNALIRFQTGAVMDVRYNLTTHKLQKTYVAFPTDSDWIDIETAVPCNTGSG